MTHEPNIKSMPALTLQAHTHAGTSTLGCVYFSLSVKSAHNENIPTPGKQKPEKQHRILLLDRGVAVAEREKKLPNRAAQLPSQNTH